MSLSILFRIVVFGILVLILISVFSVLTTGVTVENSTAGVHTNAVTVNHVKPSSCSGIFLTTMVSSSGTVTGTPGNDLIMCSPAVDTIDGQGGDDCILGGGGDDDITGNGGTDVCIGGPGTDTFVTCESAIQ